MSDIEKAKRLTHLFYVMQHQHKHEAPREDHIRRRDIMTLEAIQYILKQEDETLIKMSKVSECFNITPAAVSQMIRDYERRGWIERVVLDTDRRSVYLKVSDDAAKLIKENEEACMEDTVAFIEYLGKADSEAFIRILEKAAAYGPIMKHRKKEKRKDACEHD